ncbi:hypothetical protein XENOCAPTIV_016986, partial [Xenoophorus captivus]
VMEEFLQDQEDEFTELNDSELVWSTPPEFLDGEAVDCQTGIEEEMRNKVTILLCFSVKTCRHQLQPVTLSQVKQSDAGQVHHVRVQLRSYEPHRLHQALKLFCSRCTSM